MVVGALRVEGRLGAVLGLQIAEVVLHGRALGLQVGSSLRGACHGRALATRGHELLRAGQLYVRGLLGVVDEGGRRSKGVVAAHGRAARVAVVEVRLVDEARLLFARLVADGEELIRGLAKDLVVVDLQVRVVRLHVLARDVDLRDGVAVLRLARGRARQPGRVRARWNRLRHGEETSTFKSLSNLI